MIFRSRVGSLVSKKIPCPRFSPGSCPNAPASPPLLFVNEYQKPPVLPRFSSQMPPVLPPVLLGAPGSPPVPPRFSPHSPKGPKIEKIQDRPPGLKFSIEIESFKRATNQKPCFFVGNSEGPGGPLGSMPTAKISTLRGSLRGFKALWASGGLRATFPRVVTLCL